MQLENRNSSLSNYNNEVQQSYRILKATAKAANVLLTGDNLDEAINKALKIIGESINTDRIGIVENFDNPAAPLLPHWKITYEWDSAYAISQIKNLEVTKGSHEGIEAWYELWSKGESISCQLEDMPEPFRSKMSKIGVKTFSSVPIIIEGRYWGGIGIDDCREARRLTLPEIAVLKTAASCIGSAIYREQIQQQKEQAEIAVLDEHNRMAREIHDTLAQAFTGISLQLEAAKNVLSIQPEAALERLLQAQNLAKEGIVEARRSVRALRPKALEFSDLPTALDRLVDKMMFGMGITARVLVEGEARSLDSEIEINLFRIAQEAVTNILRHAKATEAIVQLIYEADSIYLQIKDNGVGFELRSLSNQSFGLIGMQERCDRMGGNLVINSASDRGTEIIVTVSK